MTTSNHETARAASEADTPKTAAEKLAEVLARKRGGGVSGAPTDASGQRRAERAAAHASASKSKPAPRKG